MANTNLVHDFSKYVATNITNQARCIESNIAEQLSYGTSVIINDNVHDWVRENYLDKGFDPKTVSILLNSWRLGKKLNYQSSLKRLFLYSQKHNIAYIQNPTINKRLDFLQLCMKMAVPTTTRYVLLGVLCQL